MPDATIFQIEDGVLAFTVVDTAAVGYADDWQAPGGQAVDASRSPTTTPRRMTWSCQMTSGALTATPDTTTTDVPATFCEPGRDDPAPAGRRRTAWT